MIRPATALCLLVVLSRPALADRGAFTVEAGGGGTGLLVPSPWSSPSVLTPSGAGLVVAGIRYAPSHHLELTLGGFFEPPVPEYHHGAAVQTDLGRFEGTLAHRLLRVGATAGARLIFGMVWRWVLGLELGWCHRGYSGFQLIDVGGAAPADSGLRLPSFDVESFIVAPAFGLEWAAGDHWSVSLVPRLQVLLGAEPTVALVLPLTLSWSWYL